jgi:hypothetical protein
MRWDGMNVSADVWIEWDEDARRKVDGRECDVIYACG